MDHFIGTIFDVIHTSTVELVNLYPVSLLSSPFKLIPKPQALYYYLYFIIIIFCIYILYNNDSFSPAFFTKSIASLKIATVMCRLEKKIYSSFMQ